MDWDDYRFMESIARQGSVRGAAQALGVNASTVTRRLEGLEQRLGVLLFSRSQQGLKITDEGVEVVERLQQIGDQLRDIEVSLKGRNQRLEGRIRLAIPDVLAVNFLLSELAEFTNTYPRIDLELMPGYQNLDLARGETDIAIRATETPPEAMVGRPLARVALAAYGSRRYVEHIGDVGDGSGAAWVDWAAPGEVMTLYGQLRELYARAAHKFFAKYSTVMREGYGGDACFLLLQGKVRLVTAAAQAREGVHKLSTAAGGPPSVTLGPGACFGEEALLSNVRADVSCRPHAGIARPSLRVPFACLSRPSHGTHSHCRLTATVD